MEKGQGHGSETVENLCCVKSLQQQTGLWMHTFEVKCFHLMREQWGKDQLTRISIKILMAMVVVEAQVPHEVTYMEECTTRRAWPDTKLCTNFKKGRQKIWKRIPIFFLWHMMQHAINLEEENGPDIEYKIRRFLSWVEIKFLKYGRLHLMPLGQEEDRYEEVEEDGGGSYLWARKQASIKTETNKNENGK